MTSIKRLSSKHTRRWLYSARQKVGFKFLTRHWALTGPVKDHSVNPSAEALLLLLLQVGKPEAKWP